MTTTTKVFVILVCLFALIFTPLAIQFAAREVNWRLAAETARDLAESAYANERSAYGVAASEVLDYQLLLKTERENQAKAQVAMAKLQLDLDKVAQERNELAASRDSWERSASLLTAQMNVESTRNKDLSDAKEKALARERELQAQNIQLTDRVKELSAEVTILAQQTKQQSEELAGFREDNRKLRESLKLGQAGQEVSTATPTAVGVTPVAMGGPVAGEVTEIKGPMATLNVGSSSGVREGMVMVVTRGGDYVCDLEVTKNVTPNEAVGRIMYEEPGRRIRVNDKVQDATSFETRR